MFDLGKGVIEKWERGEELLGRAVRMRERENWKTKKKKKRICF